ncbi:MAG: helix-turn-helix transcriptional regulator [Prevotella sp.]|nr:helix-turn-helix transcriptional regulator [Prevotella sp.]
MTKQEYEDRIAELEHQVEELRLTQFDLVNRNMLLAQQLDVYYDVRRRIQMLKELVIRHKELLRHADLRDDDELMAIIETKLEESLAYQDPDYSLKEVAELVGTTQTRIVDLFRRSPVHKTVDDYLDYLRLLRSMYYLQEKPMWGVAACAQEAVFSVIRTFNRKFQDAIGMTPHEFRMLLANGRNNMENNQ